MAIKRDAEGNPQWTPEQEEDIEIATEARVRAHKRIAAATKKDEQDAQCVKGQHATLTNDGKCSNCGKKPETQPNSDTRPARRGLRL